MQEHIPDKDPRCYVCQVNDRSLKECEGLRYAEELRRKAAEKARGKAWLKEAREFVKSCD